MFIERISQLIVVNEWRSHQHLFGVIPPYPAQGRRQIARIFFPANAQNIPDGTLGRLSHGFKSFLINAMDNERPDGCSGLDDGLETMLSFYQSSVWIKNNRLPINFLSSVL